MKKVHEFVVRITIDEKTTIKDAHRTLDFIIQAGIPNVSSVAYDTKNVTHVTTKSMERIKAAQRGQMFKAFKKHVESGKYHTAQTRRIKSK